MKKITTLLAFITSVIIVNAQQFDLSGEIRPRYENKNGYKSLKAKGDNSANFVSQRSRLNFDYKNENIKLGIVMQNIRVWGDVSTLANNDLGNSFHQAWAQAIVSPKVSFKMGRQEIAYDDHRIMGSVGWAQQARSHDAVLFKYAPNKKHKLDIGAAYNSDNQSGKDILYTNAAGYKAMQYAWYHTNLDSLGLGISVLALNTGIEYLKNTGLPNEYQAIDFMQTIGTRLTYVNGKLKANSSAYMQTGETVNKYVNALNFSIHGTYKLAETLTFGAGMEYLSGKDMDDTLTSTVKSFAPLFGTNHKFNGLMDYFYVGNHANNVGLIDYDVSLAYSKDKFSAKLSHHFFYSAATIYKGTDKMSDELGNEIDLTFGYKPNKDIKINAGFSTLFATESMEVLKSGDKNEFNSWGWLMVTFKPKFLSHTFSK